MVPKDDWRRRTPAFLILGAKKGGTTGLFQTLTQGDAAHQAIVKGKLKEHLYFIPSRFPHWSGREDQDNDDDDVDDYPDIPEDAMINVAEARRDMLKLYPTAKLQQNRTLITGEATPDYILYSEYSARAILCTVPWVKVIVLLRDPVDRLFSHYNFLKDPSKKFNGGRVRTMPPFETWVTKDIERLQSYGVLPENLAKLPNYMKTPAETRGWHKYQRNTNLRAMSDRPFSRSLYALQFEDWHRNLLAVGKDPQRDLKVVLSRDLTSDRGSQVVDDLLTWLGVPQVPSASSNGKSDQDEGTVKKGMVTKYSSAPIQPQFRQWLEETIIRPYNQRLYKLLPQELDGCFDTTTTPSSSSFSAPKLTSPSNVDGTSTRVADEKSLPSFVREKCDLTGADHWMVPEGDWRRRTPYFLILGAKKGGTTGTFQTLTSHPQILSGAKKELLYFIPKRFPHWTNDEIGEKVRVAPARRDFFKQFKSNILMDQPSFITGEATPDYVMYSEYSTQAILCTVPWVKVVVLLREPIERLFSHYNFIMDPNKSNRQLPPFEKWVMDDIAILQEYGVMPQDLSKIEEYMGSKQEQDAWHRYQRLKNGPWGDRPFVRSLYALQLEEWFRNLQAVGKDPKQDLRIVLSRDMKQNTSVVHDLLEWLGVNASATSFDSITNSRGRNLGQVAAANNNNNNNNNRGTEDAVLARKLNSSLEMKQSMVTTYTSAPISPEFQKRLEAIIAPYNRRLYRLLGPKYDGIFDTTST